LAELLAQVRTRIIQEAAERQAASNALTETPSAEQVPPTRLLLRVEEVAEALAISRSSVYELLRSGDLPCVRIGGSTRVSVEALREWIRRREGR
jgi:excisionase family DNA binding protein